MTALKQYARLESMGVWHESPATQRRDVVVRFGNSTLVLTDKNDLPLAHWSLAAVARVNPGEAPAVFAPGTHDPETLEIEDETMVAAIEKVRTLIARRRPQPGRLRLWLLALSAAAVVALLVFWMPGALINHTVSVLPQATRAEVGTELLTAITRVSGQPCASPRGSAALATLSTRLLGPEGGEIIVVPGGVRSVEHLPGGLILISRTLIEDHDSPDVVAGYVLAETLRREAQDPMERVLQGAGLLATFRLLTSGAIPEAALETYAETALGGPQVDVEDSALLARFAETKVSSAAYAYALDVTGESTLALIEADPMRQGSAPILSDGDWVSLQGICGG